MPRDDLYLIMMEPEWPPPVGQWGLYGSAEGPDLQVRTCPESPLVRLGFTKQVMIWSGQCDFDRSTRCKTTIEACSGGYP